MSRRNLPRLEVGGVYQLDGRKRRWTLTRLVAGHEYVLTSPGRESITLTPMEAQRRLREVWG